MAASTYDAATKREPWARAIREAELIELKEVWEANYCVDGVGTLWTAALLAGIDTGRDHTARLRRAAGIEGVSRSQTVWTTGPDTGAAGHPDLVDRDVTATAGNQWWVTDVTFVDTWAGVAYACVIINAFSPISVGWKVACHMPTTMVLDTSELARWLRGAHLRGRRCHCDTG